MGQTGASAAKGRQHQSPSPSSPQPLGYSRSRSLSTRAASSLPAHLPNTPNHPYFYCHKLMKSVTLRRGARFLCHRSLCTRTSVQEALCFASLFCLVGTLLMALNFCEKTSGEQTLQARYALAGHRKQSRLLFSACPLASSCLAS